MTGDIEICTRTGIVRHRDHHHGQMTVVASSAGCKGGSSSSIDFLLGDLQGSVGRFCSNGCQHRVRECQ
jgi:hypothetical protein